MKTCFLAGGRKSDAALGRFFNFLKNTWKICWAICLVGKICFEKIKVDHLNDGGLEITSREFNKL